MAIAAEAGLNFTDLDVCDFLWLNAKLKAKRSDYVLIWNVARFISFFAVKPYDSKNRIKRFTDLIEFDWEKTERVPIKRFTEEQLRTFHESSLALFERIAEKDKDASGFNT